MIFDKKCWKIALAIGWTAVLAGCGTPTVSASPPAPVTSHAQKKPKSHAGTHTRVPQTPASSVQWPSLVRQALSVAAKQTAVSLMGPTDLPRGNSATITVKPDAYAVTVYQCPTPQPLNSPSIGSGLCGAMASFAEGFGGTRYASPSAIHRALAYQTPPQTPVPMTLPGHLTANRWRRQGQTGTGSTMAIVWREGDWTIVISGGPPERSTAVMVAHLLQQYLLPPHSGLLTVDVAADGLHTSVQWAVGDTIYFTAATHNPAHAIAIAASMAVYPPNP